MIFATKKSVHFLYTKLLPLIATIAVIHAANIDLSNYHLRASELSKLEVSPYKNIAVKVVPPTDSVRYTVANVDESDKSLIEAGMGKGSFDDHTWFKYIFAFLKKNIGKNQRIKLCVGDTTFTIYEHQQTTVSLYVEEFPNLVVTGFLRKNRQITLAKEMISIITGYISYWGIPVQLYYLHMKINNRGGHAKKSKTFIGTSFSAQVAYENKNEETCDYEAYSVAVSRSILLGALYGVYKKKNKGRLVTFICEPLLRLYKEKAKKEGSKSKITSIFKLSSSSKNFENDCEMLELLTPSKVFGRFSPKSNIVLLPN